MSKEFFLLPVRDAVEMTLLPSSESAWQIDNAIYIVGPPIEGENWRHLIRLVSNEGGFQNGFSVVMFAVSQPARRSDGMALPILQEYPLYGSMTVSAHNQTELSRFIDFKSDQLNTETNASGFFEYMWQFLDSMRNM